MGGDGAGFLAAIMPAADLVHNLARRLTNRRADAEDLVQETYLRAWPAWTDGSRPDRVAPWLATICLNLRRDRLRRAANRVETAWDEALRRLPDEQRIAITGAPRGTVLARVHRGRKRLAHSIQEVDRHAP